MDRSIYISEEGKKMFVFFKEPFKGLIVQKNIIISKSTVLLVLS